MCSFFFFFNDTATTEIYTLSLHDALPISERPLLNVSEEPVGAGRGQAASRGEKDGRAQVTRQAGDRRDARRVVRGQDRKSTRLNSSHANISYAVFCLKKKKHKKENNVELN